MLGGALVTGKRRSKRLLTVLAACFALFAFFRPCEAKSWWKAEWSCRRSVKVDGFVDSSTDAFVFEFCNGAKTREDGRDIRVVANGRVVPHWLVWHTPGGLTRIAAQYQRGVRDYDIYYGNPYAPHIRGQWRPRSGLWLETRRFRGRFPTSWSKMRQDLERTKGDVYDRGLVSQIYHGYNPYGPSGYSINIYKGTLDAPRDGRYQLASNATEASFLLLDGKVIQQWAGWLWARNRARGVKRLTLKKGLHPIEFYSVATRWRQVSVVAWRTPGMRGRKFEVIPASAFVPVARARQTSYEIRGEDVAPDFTFENLDEVHTGFTILVRLRFVDRSGASRGGRHKRVWDFGDGQKGEGARVEHVYFRPCPRKVTLTLTSGRKKWSVAHVVPAQQNWARQADRSLRPSAREYVRVIERYDFSKLHVADLLTALQVFHWKNVAGGLRSALRALVARAKSMNDRDLRKASELTLLAFENSERRDREGVAALQSFRAAARAPGTKAAITMDLADYFLRFNVSESAQKEAQAALAMKPAALEKRRAHVVLGDVALDTGDVKTARENYEAAEKIKISKRSAKHELVRVGAFTRIIEDYIRQGRHDAAEEMLDRLEWDIPTARLDGYSKILRGRILLGLGRCDEGAGMLERLVASMPKNSFADDALLLAAQIHLERKPPKKTEAAADLKRLLKDYPESSHIGEAKRLLKDSGG